MQAVRSRPSWVDPRSRGGDASRSRSCSASSGRSPLTRGRLSACATTACTLRSIPAHAGETSRHLVRHSDYGVDPRSRGGDAVRDTASAISMGRSPLTRGRPKLAAKQGDGEGSIPAHAGETHVASSTGPVVGVDPRSRGGDADRLVPVPLLRGRSPLTRGRLLASASINWSRGSIPAHAGETTSEPQLWL